MLIKKNKKEKLSELQITIQSLKQDQELSANKISSLENDLIRTKNLADEDLKLLSEQKDLQISKSNYNFRRIFLVFKFSLFVKKSMTKLKELRMNFL